MKTTRLEAFSDGVLAIVITIMVLELKVPHGDSFATLMPLLPVFLSYVLSFSYVGLYWNNHHHLLSAAERVNGKLLWANLHLLFWLSLLPFATGWLGENHLAALPTALYGGVLLMAAIAYYLLERSLILTQGRKSVLASAVGDDPKAKFSVLLYCVAIPLSFWKSWVACGIYILVAILWIIPDPRIEQELIKQEQNDE
jgi:uncharacterized membrane protein